MADNTPLPPSTGSTRSAATDEVNYSGDVANVQLVRLVDVTGAEGSKTVLSPHALVSTLNSSATNIAGGGTFIGAAEDVSDYSHITVALFSSHASATDGLIIQQSSDGANWDLGDIYSVPAATGKSFSAPVQAKFSRISYANGATLTTAFRLQVIYSKRTKKGSSIRPQDGRSNDNDVEELAAYLTGYNGTSWDRLRATIANGLAVDVTRLPALTAGTAIIGKAGIDQAAPGTSNGVQINALTYPQSTSNNTSAQLAAGATFTGGVETILSLQAAQVEVVCDQPYTVTIFQYIDAAGTQLSSTDVFTRTAGVPLNENVTLPGNYFKLSIQNTGAAATTTLRLDCTFGIMATSPRALSNLGNYKVAVLESLPAGANTIGGVTVPDLTTSGSLAALNATLALALNQAASASVEISGTWSGTISFEATDSGTVWNPINGTASSTSTPATSTTVNGLYRLTPGALAQIRVNMSAFVSGSATITIRSSIGGGGVFANQILPTKNTDGVSSQAIKAASTAAAATDHAAVVSLSPNSPVPLSTITKGTQGATGVTTQDLKDAGRNQTNYFMVGQIISTATDALQSLTGYKSGAAVAATTTPAVVTTGKNYRLTRVVISYVAILTAGSVRVTLRCNTAGVVAITSPAVDTWMVGANAATAGVAETIVIVLPDGIEFAAGSGIGVSVQGFGATGTAAATGYALVSIGGYEY